MKNNLQLPKQIGLPSFPGKKEGLLNNKDKILRTKYARSAKKLLHDFPDFYTGHVSFYLDGVSFVHKYNRLNAAIQPKVTCLETERRGAKERG